MNHTPGNEYVCGNIFVRQMVFDADRPVVEGHEHNFDHVTYIVRGRVLIEELADDEQSETVMQNAIPTEIVVKPATVIRAVEKAATDGFNWILIKAGVRHRLTALTADALGHCIYSHRNPQGEVVVAYDGWGPAYV